MYCKSKAEKQLNLCGWLLIGAEWTIEHDNAVFVEPKRYGRLHGEFGPTGNGGHMGLPFPCHNVQILDVLHDQVIVHFETLAYASYCWKLAVSVLVITSDPDHSIII